MRQEGFSLIEMLLSVALVAMLVGLSIPVYFTFQSRNELDIATGEIAAALRRAQTYARGVKADSQWSVAIQNGSAVLYQGTTYATRDTAADEETNIPSTVAVSGLSNVQFTKLTGAPNTDGSITLTGPNNTRTITINAKGTVDY